SLSLHDAHPIYLIQLKISLKKIPELRNTLQQLEKQSLEQIIDDLTYPEEVVDILEKSIAEDPPISITEGGIIKDGFNEQLDKYRDALKNGRKWIQELERKEKEIGRAHV